MIISLHSIFAVPPDVKVFKNFNTKQLNSVVAMSNNLAMNDEKLHLPTVPFENFYRFHPLNSISYHVQLGTPCN